MSWSPLVCRVPSPEIQKNMGDEAPSTVWEVKYDPSGRASCKYANCNMKIVKGAVRISKTFDNKVTGHSMSHHHHPECLLSLMMPKAKNWGFNSGEEFDGYDALSPADKKFIDELLAAVQNKTIVTEFHPRGAPKDAKPQRAADIKAAKATAKRLREGDADGGGGSGSAAADPKRTKKADPVYDEHEAEYGGGEVAEPAAASGAGKGAPPPAKNSAKGSVGDNISNEPVDLTGTFVFTGVRDSEAQDAIVAAGGQIAASFTGKVTAVITKDEASDLTEKIKGAIAKGVPIYTIAMVRAALGLD